MDIRFPMINQNKHCFKKFVEYHKCMHAKGDEASSKCEKYARYYHSLCATEWARELMFALISFYHGVWQNFVSNVQRWNEQLENGTFVGPL
ncbi:hypothetical protein KP509_05G023200 [Ceratopteris richardii]|uniref:Uncharacterized protein n=1 Tax=Ceratopteris richardii TaxID=49495 RepID=A0A8T2UWP5_CERRI|nr:hypothetical protein KP509_05G023200 [Ceratopteris richardii]